MAKSNFSRAQNTGEKWSGDTTNSFQFRIYEITSILSVLISNIGEYKKDDGRATDEAIFLAIQQATSTTVELEKLSCEFDQNDGASVGDLSLCLMWARALLEILEGMIYAEGWKIRLSDDVLSSYLSAVERRINQANVRVEKIHAHYFQKAA